MSLGTTHNGCGDTDSSWAVDGGRVFKWHGAWASAEQWGAAWAAGDVVGLALDFRADEQATLSVAKNGSWAPPMGVAFRLPADVPPKE